MCEYVACNRAYAVEHVSSRVDNLEVLAIEHGDCTCCKKPRPPWTSHFVLPQYRRTGPPHSPHGHPTDACTSILRTSHILPRNVAFQACQRDLLQE